MGGMVARLKSCGPAPEHAMLRLALLDTNPCPDTPEQAAQRRGANAAVLASGNFEALAIFSLKYLVHAAAPAGVRNALVDMSMRVGPKAYARQNVRPLRS